MTFSTRGALLQTRVGMPRRATRGRPVPAPSPAAVPVAQSRQAAEAHAVRQLRQLRRRRLL